MEDGQCAVDFIAEDLRQILSDAHNKFAENFVTGHGTLSAEEAAKLEAERDTPEWRAYYADPRNYYAC